MTTSKDKNFKHPEKKEKLVNFSICIWKLVETESAERKKCQTIN
jgi:hypothetical protein